MKINRIRLQNFGAKVEATLRALGPALVERNESHWMRAGANILQSSWESVAGNDARQQHFRMAKVTG